MFHRRCRRSIQSSARLRNFQNSKLRSNRQTNQGSPNNGVAFQQAPKSALGRKSSLPQQRIARSELARDVQDIDIQ
jgi:hypothetical protein